MMDSDRAGPEGSAVPAGPSHAAAARARDGGPRRFASRPTVRPEPEVLVPPDQTDALVRFVAVVRQGRRAPTSFMAAGEPSTDLAEPAPIDIPPLEIVPLDPAETSGT